MSEGKNYRLEQREIQAFLPHRYPFLMVDRILDITGPGALDDDNPKTKVGIKVVGIKNVSVNEPYFTGHFPNMPIMPGVQIIEAMAQCASFAFYPTYMKKTAEERDGFRCFLVGVDGARFRVPVVPGDTIRFETEVSLCRSTMWAFACKAYVEGKLVAEANLMANLVVNS
jgi:3-hydroxyacyl-[acyl-carrier-protein] dehydratase